MQTNSHRQQGRQSTHTLDARRERQIVVLIALAHLVLSTAFSLAGPTFEGVDEIEHYRFIRLLVALHTLPDARNYPHYQSHQAPLSYLLAAPVLALTGDTDYSTITSNPFFGYLFAEEGNDNKNRFLHSRAEAFPFLQSQTALAVHLIRLISLAVGLGTVLASYAVFRQLWPIHPERRLLALGIVAFWPQFVFLSGMINNDNLLLLLTTINLLLLLVLTRQGPSGKLAAWQGGMLGLALLTKANAVFLLVPLSAWVLLNLRNRQAWRHVLIVLSIAFGVSGWWYARNIFLYGDASGMIVPLAVRGGPIRPGALALDVALQRLPFVYQTFWARFGQTSIPAGKTIYSFFDVLTVLALSGALIAAARFAARLRRGSVSNLARQQVILIGILLLTWLASVIYGASIGYNLNQGRYLLPGIAGWAALFTLGLEAWLPDRWRLPIALAGCVTLASITVISFARYYVPAYRPLAVPDQIEHPLAYRFEDAAELIGVSPPVTRARPGSTVAVTLYWRAISPTEVPLYAYLHSVESDLVRRDSHPATGNLLSTDWQSGQSWAERYLISIPANAETQVAYTLIAGLYDPQADRVLPATQDGMDMSPGVGLIAVNGPVTDTEPAYRFGDAIGLALPTISQNGNQVGICLPWVSLAPTSTNYTFFTQLRAEDSRLIDQTEASPHAGRYPTNAWSPSEVIEDCLSLAVTEPLKSGWQIAVGLYDPNTGARLPVKDETGQLLANDEVLIQP